MDNSKLKYQKLHVFPKCPKSQEMPHSLNKMLQNLKMGQHVHNGAKVKKVKNSSESRNVVKPMEFFT